jgi:hypothetical protein
MGHRKQNGGMAAKNPRIFLLSLSAYCTLGSASCGIRLFFLRERSFSMWKDRGYCAVKRSPRTWGRAAILWAACLMVLGFAAPARVRAECGDYVIHDSNLSAPASAPFSRQAHAEPIHSKGACHGPHCSRGAPLPLMPVATVPVATEQWGCVTVVSVTTELPLARCHLEDLCRFPSGHEQVIYHPPRSLPTHLSL